MRNFLGNRVAKTIVILGIIGLGLLFFFYYKTEPVTPVLDKVENLGPVQTVIGASVEGRKIDAYTYGNGEVHLAFIGGIHGGYEWNSVVLAYKFMDYLESNREVIPDNITVVVIPVANPDGLYKVIGKEGRFTSLDIGKASTVPGRFNAHNVDLNRNFDCKWKPKSTWRENIVSAGSKPFSEPESGAIRNFVLENNPKAVIFWHSQGNAVYASQCEKGILPETTKIMIEYARASGYSANPSFDAYETTGDADAWLSKIGIPAITVELKTHESIDWEKNLAGAKALFQYYNLSEKL